MSKVIVLQSFRNYDVPTWIIRCQESVKHYASQQGWEYNFIGDELFNFAPAWAKEAVKNNIYALSDVCRLEWMKQVLTTWDAAIWADIDILVIDPSRIIVDLKQSYGFSYELYFTNEGSHDGINNAFMFFRRNSRMLNVYLEKCYEVLHHHADNNVFERTVIGPDLLRKLNVPQCHIIQGLNILNFAALSRIYNNPTKQIPDYITSRTRSLIGAANLCLNERSIFEGNNRTIYDHIIENVSEALLNNIDRTKNPQQSTDWQQRGEIIRRNQTCPCGSGKKYKHCHGAYKVRTS